MQKSRKMDEYVKDLFNAFCSVDSQFYFCEALADPQAVLNDEPNKKTLIQLTERHFSAELYSEWRQIIKQSPNNYTNLLIGFEVSKRFIRNEFVKDKASFRPDLILHQSQLDFNVNYQKIFVEIKTTFSLNRRKIKPDLNKIIFAINQIRQGTTIKQLAYTLGYHHSSSFIEFFKRYTGQTPIQLKNASI